VCEAARVLPSRRCHRRALACGDARGERSVCGRLNRLTDAFQRGVEQGNLPGVVVAIARDGRLVCEHAFGFQNREEKISMTTEAIFRLASMSKPIMAVAAMVLMEEEKVDIAAPQIDPATNKRPPVIVDPTGKPRWLCGGRGVNGR
jgi:CubicO group peptidase (beta-lactamase class C family)